MLPDRPSSISAGVALGFLSKAARMATTKPGVQKPHCWASCWTKAAGHRVELAAVDQRLGRLDLLALGLQGQHGAGVDRLAVEQDGAGAAGAAIADALAAGDVEVIAQGVEQRDARLDAGWSSWRR